MFRNSEIYPLDVLLSDNCPRKICILDKHLILRQLIKYLQHCLRDGIIFTSLHPKNIYVTSSNEIQIHKSLIQKTDISKISIETLFESSTKKTEVKTNQEEEEEESKQELKQTEEKTNQEEEEETKQELKQTEEKTNQEEEESKQELKQTEEKTNQEE